MTQLIQGQQILSQAEHEGPGPEQERESETEVTRVAQYTRARQSAALGDYLLQAPPRAK